VACNTIVHHRLTHSRRLYPAGVWLTVRSDPEPTAWLEALVNGSGVLSRFLRFRAESVARLVAELAEEARRLGLRRSSARATSASSASAACQRPSEACASASERRACCAWIGPAHREPRRRRRVKMPDSMRFRTALALMRGGHWPEVVHPPAHVFVRDC
jgi:hypothetical protein